MKSFLDGRVVLHPGDCADVIKTLADNSIDAVVTDPPYALVSIVKRFGKNDAEPVKAGSVYARSSSGFMNQRWDNGAVAFSVEFWAEVLRVLKPGAHVVAFGGTRTFHRLACAIEDAGFEVRDALMWHFATGFPKSHDIAKNIDKDAGHWRGRAGDVDERTVGQPSKGTEYIRNDKDSAITDAARQWEGWGTALKPATEIICLARKPLSEPTIAANVLRWGTGAIHVDACRIQGGGPSSPRGSSKLDTDANEGWMRPWMKDRAEVAKREAAAMERLESLGRWPANLCHDNSPEVLGAFPETGTSSAKPRNNGEFKSVAKGRDAPHVTYGHADNGGSAARFFFSAKADANNRIGSKHPTVKPVALMQWLCRLICPPGGTILDPFAGTGTTGEAAWREGFNAVLIEREAEYQADIARRMKHVRASGRERKETIAKAKSQVESAGPLFGEIECT